MDAFDSDVLIYAVDPVHPLGRRIRTLFSIEPATTVGVGSVLLLPEVLAKPMREGILAEVTVLTSLLARLELSPVDPVIAELATSFAATYRLRAPDAVHLATAVAAGADRLITNNRRDFPKSITDIGVTYPDDLS